jgi:3-hydroxyacyl-[acyl-carrier-protein] dehydratase
LTVTVPASDTTQDTRALFAYLPHRYPFLLVDRILECRDQKTVVALKNVTYNEWFFPGHFPGDPIMPGVLILEAMAQASSVVVNAILGGRDERIAYYLAGIEKARFRGLVRPGDSLRIVSNLIRRVHDIWKFEATAYVDDAVMVEAIFLCATKIQPAP